MLIVDAHCDTLSKLSLGEFDTQFKQAEIKDSYLQVFAIFSGHDTDEQINCYNALQGFKKCESKNDLSALKCGDLCAILSVEGGEMIKNDLNNLVSLYNIGVRIFGLCWNNNNDICASAMSESDFGLTKFGESAVKLCEKLNITVDLSHASKKTCADVLSLSNKPVIFSHSNSYSVCAHKRNITDDTFKALINNGGVAGINFYPPFLTDKNHACIDDVLFHIEHFLSLGGENNVGIGSDFDGIDKTPVDLCRTRDIYTLIDRLISLYPYEIVKKLAGENFMRVFLTNLVKYA